MNLEKVIFAFVILLAATLNLGFVYGEIDRPDHHHLWELFATTTVNLIAVVLKFGDRTHIGAIHLASSLVALAQLAGAALFWFFAAPPAGGSWQPGALSSVISLAVGALLANVVSVIIMIVDTTIQRR
jgi:hypothetical protein